MEVNLPIGYQIAACAQRFLAKNALVIAGEEYSYDCLFQQVYELYAYLKDKQIQSTRIGVYCTNDLQTYASILAINLYGAAFVPLNPLFPKDKLDRLIDQADLTLVLNLSEDRNRWKVISYRIDEGRQTDLDFSKFKPVLNQEEAYVLFTSGTTGAPKGVVITHQKMKALFSHFLEGEIHSFTSEDRFIQPAELSFDLSIFTVFMPLLVGASCHVPSNQGIRYMEILKCLIREKISIVTLVPSSLGLINRQLKNQRLPAVRTSLFIGDQLLHSECLKWQENCPNSSLYNYYGPTEATVMCGYYTWSDLHPALESVVPIGRPFPNIQYAVLDEANNLVPQGEIGELALSGNQVISSYLNEQHQDRFVELPENGKKVAYYKTGDLVYLDNNNIYHFVGRTDSQVKINGFRIELTEIEEFIRPHLTGNFLLLKHELPHGLHELVLFIEGEEIDLTRLKNDLVKNLPAYMHPNREIFLNYFPLNSNDKVDRIALKNLL